MKRIMGSVIGLSLVGVAVGSYLYVSGPVGPGALGRSDAKRGVQSKRDTAQASPPLSTIERAALTHALAKKLERTQTDPASFIVEPNPHVTDADKQVRIPRNTDEELQNLAKALDLTEMQQRKAKSLIEAFSHGQALLEKYPEPARTIKRHELQRQFRLSLHTALPREKEEAADKYLEATGR
jgi:hypothetical protein